MSTVEERVSAAFSGLRPSDELNQRTKAYIEAVRTQNDKASAEVIRNVSLGAQSADTQSADAQTASGQAKAPAARRKQHSIVRFAGAAAACLLVVACGLFVVWNHASAYVGIDVNPSIELGVNRFGVVIDARGINDDGKAVLEALQDEKLNLEGKAYEDALQTLFESAALTAYVKSDSFAQLSVLCENEQLAAELQNTSARCLQSVPCEAMCNAVSEQDYRAAQEAGMGVGRYLVAQELIAKNPTYTLDVCQTMTMRQLRDALSACDSSQGEDNGGFQGHGHRYGAE